MIEYRIGWACNVQGAGDEGEWLPYDGDEATAEAVENAIRETGGGLSRGLEEALEASGFDWWVEAREAPTVGAIGGDDA